MRFDTTNYSGQGAAGAVPFAGPNAAGMPRDVFHGRGVAGTEDSKPQTLPGDALAGGILELAADPSANTGVSDGSDTTNGTLVIDAAVYAAGLALSQRGVVIVPPRNVAIP